MIGILVAKKDNIIIIEVRFFFCILARSINFPIQKK